MAFLNFLNHFKIFQNFKTPLRTKGGVAQKKVGGYLFYIKILYNFYLKKKMSEELFLCHNFFKCFLALLGTTGASYRVGLLARYTNTPPINQKKCLRNLDTSPCSWGTGGQSKFILSKTEKKQFLYKFHVFLSDLEVFCV